MNRTVTFGQVVKERRMSLGLTQAELGRRVGCAPITTRKIEADNLRPSVQVAERLAVALIYPKNNTGRLSGWRASIASRLRFPHHNQALRRSARRISPAGLFGALS